jgi:hypothetical protein
MARPVARIELESGSERPVPDFGRAGLPPRTGDLGAWLPRSGHPDGLGGALCTLHGKFGEHGAGKLVHGPTGPLIGRLHDGKAARERRRSAPSLVIATVDKLAQLPWRGYAGLLFGRVSSRRPRHGYRHDDLDARTGCKQRHNASRLSGLPAVTSQPVTRLRPPDLIIQDELHLISGALGTTVGLFEAAVDELCRWRVGEMLTGPKIVASTATTKRAPEQVRGVFARGLAVFPPSVIDIADTFFSRQVPVTPETPGRRYLGISAERPGLIVTLYNWSRPRDLAHYEDFEHYHATY